LPEGELIVWKKLRHGEIAKLLIPANAERVNAIGYRKCRFGFAKVLEIWQDGVQVNAGLSIHGEGTLYKVGEIVKPDKFDPNPLEECSHGIHAFITRLEAEEYN